MNEKAVRAAIDRLLNESHGLLEPVGRGEACRMVPLSVIDDLVDAASMPAEPAPAPAEPAA